MTALATILGLLPMAFGFGEGAEANMPLARAVIGGMLVSCVMTCFSSRCYTPGGPEEGHDSCDLTWSVRW